MKVLLTHERFAPDFAGGGEYVVLEIARHLIRSGVDVRVLTPGDPAVADYEGIPTTRLPIHRYRMNFQASVIEHHAAGCDLIQTFNYHACYASLKAAKRLGLPSVCQFLALFDDAWVEMKGPIGGRFFRALERRLVRLPFDRSIFLSDFSMRMGLAMGAPSATSLVLAPGVDVEQYTAADTKDYVLFVGKFDVRKGVDDILAVAARLPDVPFLLYGWGQRQQALRDQAPANVRVESFERGAPLREVFSKAKIFLFPSRAETFGVAVVEAMASGCAVVSSIPVGFEGATVSAGDIDGITAAVRELWDDPTRARRAGTENVARAARFSWDRSIRELIRLYEEILTPPRRTS